MTRWSSRAMAGCSPAVRAWARILAYEQFTNPSPPDSTWDQIFTWTGTALGWDIYGHPPVRRHEDVDIHPSAGRSAARGNEDLM